MCYFDMIITKCLFEYKIKVVIFKKLNVKNNKNRNIRCAGMNKSLSSHL